MTNPILELRFCHCLILSQSHLHIKYINVYMCTDECISVYYRTYQKVFPHGKYRLHIVYLYYNNLLLIFEFRLKINSFLLCKNKIIKRDFISYFCFNFTLKYDIFICIFIYLNFYLLFDLYDYYMI